MPGLPLAGAWMRINTLNFNPDNTEMLFVGLIADPGNGSVSLLFDRVTLPLKAQVCCSRILSDPALLPPRPQITALPKSAFIILDWCANCIFSYRMEVCVAWGWLWGEFRSFSRYKMLLQGC